MKIGTIYMFAAFGDLSKPQAGGGQNSARRLKNTIESMGIDVKIYNKYYNYKRGSRLDTIRKFLFWFIDIILWGKFLLFKKRKNSPVLFLSYCGKLLPFDLGIGIVSKLLGYKVIFYYKGGGANTSYEKGGSIYRFLFRWLMNLFDEVMVEGRETLSLVSGISHTRTYYLPNYIENYFTPSLLPTRNMDVIKCIYFGRIKEYKNVLLVIDIFDRLCKKYPNIELLLIGSGNGKYESLVHKRITQSSHHKSICWISTASHVKIKEILHDQHFFIFPSAEPKEGHSNSLNEAMAWGVIPIVSHHNFLPDIVDDDSLVAKGYQADSYASIISNIIEQEKFQNYSEKLYQRVKDNFTEKIIFEKLKKEFVNFWKVHYEHVNC